MKARRLIVALLLGIGPAAALCGVLAGVSVAMSDAAAHGPAPPSLAQSIPITQVTILLPAHCVAEMGCTFTAAVTPQEATRPISYTWQATNHGPVTHEGQGIRDVVTLTWMVSGTQTVMVTAANGESTYESQLCEVEVAPRWWKVYLPVVGEP